MPVTRKGSEDTAVNKTNICPHNVLLPVTFDNLCHVVIWEGGVCMFWGMYGIQHISTTRSALSPILTSKGHHSTRSLCCLGHCVPYQAVFIDMEAVLLLGAFGFMFYCHCFEMLNNFTLELVFCK